jgi:hypothetical protein
LGFSEIVGEPHHFDFDRDHCATVLKVPLPKVLKPTLGAFNTVEATAGAIRVRDRRALRAEDGERLAHDHGTIEESGIRTSCAVGCTRDGGSSRCGRGPDEPVAFRGETVHAKAARARTWSGVRRVVHAIYDGAKVVVLTRHLDNGYVQRLFSAGASGYVLKQSQVAEILAAIRTVARGAKYLDSRISAAVVEDVDLRNRISPRFTDMSQREEQDPSSRRLGYGNTEIANRLPSA